MRLGGSCGRRPAGCTSLRPDKAVRRAPWRVVRTSSGRRRVAAAGQGGLGSVVRFVWSGRRRADVVRAAARRCGRTRRSGVRLVGSCGRRPAARVAAAGQGGQACALSGRADVVRGCTSLRPDKAVRRAPCRAGRPCRPVASCGVVRPASRRCGRTRRSGVRLVGSCGRRPAGCASLRPDKAARRAPCRVVRTSSGRCTSLRPDKAARRAPCRRRADVVRAACASAAAGQGVGVRLVVVRRLRPARVAAAGQGGRRAPCRVGRTSSGPLHVAAAGQGVLGHGPASPPPRPRAEVLRRRTGGRRPARSPTTSRRRTGSRRARPARAAPPRPPGARGAAAARAAR